MTGGDCFEILHHRKYYFKYSIEHTVWKGRRESHGKLQEPPASSEGDTTQQVLPLEDMHHLLENCLLKYICSKLGTSGIHSPSSTQLQLTPVNGSTQIKPNKKMPHSFFRVLSHLICMLAKDNEEECCVDYQKTVQHLQ